MYKYSIGYKDNNKNIIINIIIIVHNDDHLLHGFQSTVDFL